MKLLKPLLAVSAVLVANAAKGKAADGALTVSYQGVTKTFTFASRAVMHLRRVAAAAAWGGGRRGILLTAAPEDATSTPTPAPALR
jgi:hypothetical protein